MNSDELFFEKIFDAEFNRSEIPHKIKDLAFWHLLTVTEDMYRMIFMKSLNGGREEAKGAAYIIDRSKYALRNSMDLMNKTNLLDVSYPTPQKTIPDSYIRASKLYCSAMEYVTANSIFSQIYSGRATIIKNNDIYALNPLKQVNLGYSALEVLNHGNENSFDISGYLVNHLRELGEDSIVSKLILRCSSIKAGRVVYKYDHVATYELSQNIGQRKFIFGSDFEFPWGTGFETHVLINSLQIRCLYHLLAVNMTAYDRRVVGGAESSLLLCLSRNELINDISVLANFDNDKIGQFLDYITYGFKSKTPDPSLQPIFVMKNGKLMIPAFHILTCNIQRNMLSLMARISPKQFNEKSSHFEKAMTNELMSKLSKWEHIKSGCDLKIAGQREEIDILLVDPEHHFALMFELRWMIQPGDPREIDNRLNVCSEKVGQLERKLIFARKNFPIILKRVFNLDIEESEKNKWNIQGVVVIEGYGGEISSNPDIPIVTSEIAKLGIELIDNSLDFYDWARSLKWLPVEGEHFSPKEIDVKIESYVIKQPGIEMISDSDEFVLHVKSTANELNAT